MIDLRHLHLHLRLKRGEYLSKIFFTDAFDGLFLSLKVTILISGMVECNSEHRLRNLFKNPIYRMLGRKFRKR